MERTRAFLISLGPLARRQGDQLVTSTTSSVSSEGIRSSTDLFVFFLVTRGLFRARTWVEMVRENNFGPKRIDRAHQDDRAFLVQVILCVVAILSVGFFLRLPHKKSEMPAREKLVRIDFIGALLLILIVFGLLFGLDRGTNLSWRSPVALVSLCLPVPLLIALLLVETRFAVEPILPGHIIFDRNLVACYSHNFFLYAALTALIFYIPFFFEVVLEMTPAQAGTGLIPTAISCVMGTLIGGLLLKRLGKFYWLAVIASITGAVASILISIAPSLHEGSLITVYVASVLSFVPLGITVTASLIAVSKLYLPEVSSLRPKTETLKRNLLPTKLTLSFHSLQCHLNRPSSSNSMRISLPLFGRRRRRLPGRSSSPARTEHKSPIPPRSRRSKTNPRTHRPQPGVHQDAPPCNSRNRARVLRQGHPGRLHHVHEPRSGGGAKYALVAGEDD